MSFFKPAPCTFAWWFALGTAGGGLLVLFTDTFLRAATFVLRWKSTPRA
jgi:hypothetical protein